MRDCEYRRSTSLTLALAVAGCISVTGPGLAAEASAQARPYALHIRIEDSRVSAEMVEVPLVEALKALARQSDFEVFVEGSIDRRVSLSRDNVEIAELLGELLQHCSWFSLFEPGEAAGGTRLSQIRILQSPGCDGVAVGGSPMSANEPAARAQPAPTSFSTIAKDDLVRRKQYLNQVINGRARALVDELVETARDPRDVSLRMLALMALGRTGGPEAKAALLEALSDENATARSIAVRSLANGWGEEAVAPIDSLLSTETEPQVIHTAVQQLGGIDTEAAWDGLRRAADSNHPRVSAIAQEAISFYKQLKKRSN